MSESATYAKNCIDSLIRSILELRTLLAEMEKTSVLLLQHLRDVRRGVTVR